MTGISDVFKTSRRVARYMVQSAQYIIINKLPLPLAQLCMRYLYSTQKVRLTCPQPITPDPRATLALHCDTKDRSVSNNATPEWKFTAPDAPRWAILLPMTSRGSSSPAAFWERLETTAHKLVASIPCERRERTTIHIAYDVRDPVIDCPDGLARIMSLFAGIRLRLTSLPPAFEGKICWIWAKLAADSVAAGADLFVLLGDDVHLEKDTWQAEVETAFTDVAQECRLPYGCACIAIQDESYPAFPTFPVIHRLHLEVFNSKLFPPEFKNQHGDPFLFEVYRRWGAARFTGAGAVLYNTVGGPNTARYIKHDEVNWRGDVLSKAIDKLEHWMSVNAPDSQRIPCLDVVVPTYRCNVDMLRALVSLHCDDAVSLHSLIVVDRPDAPNLKDIQALSSYAPNRVVRISLCNIQPLRCLLLQKVA